jgi:GTP-binding protein Era
LNKIDKVHPKEMLLQALAEMSERYEFAEVIPISAKNGDNVDRSFSRTPSHFFPRT